MSTLALHSGIFVWEVTKIWYCHTVHEGCVSSVGAVIVIAVDSCVSSDLESPMVSVVPEVNPADTSALPKPKGMFMLTEALTDISIAISELLDVESYMFTADVIVQLDGVWPPISVGQDFATIHCPENAKFLQSRVHPKPHVFDESS